MTRSTGCERETARREWPGDRLGGPCLRSGHRATGTIDDRAPAPAVSTQRAVLDKYCVGCHNERTKTANLMLDKLDLARLGDHAAEAEKVVRKLRAGMMPPEGMPKPDPATREALIGWLEKELDRNALASPICPRQDSTASTAPSIRTRSGICWVCRLMPRHSCRPMIRPTASTTWRKPWACRRR